MNKFVTFTKVDIIASFGINRSSLKGCALLFSQYHNELYEGAALIIFTKDDKLYEVMGSH